jgi:hypothetical protein
MPLLTEAILIANDEHDYTGEQEGITACRYFYILLVWEKELFLRHNFYKSVQVMETVFVQLTDKSAYKRLLELETLNLIKVIKNKEKLKVKPSERFAGKLDMSEEEYQNFQLYLTDVRKEWDRDF